MPFVGASVKRFEDSRLLRGEAGFIEDLELPRQLYVAFVRSVYPHARIRSVDLDAARSTDGVVEAVVGANLGNRRIRASVTHPALRPCGQPILADGVVRYVGEPIAAVVAESRPSAQDGAAWVLVDYDPLQPVPSAEAAIEFSAPLIHAQVPDNIAGDFEVKVGDPDAAFATADRIVRGRFYVQRYTGMPLEAR